MKKQIKPKGMPYSIRKNIDMAFSNNRFKVRVDSEASSPMGVINDQTGPDWKPTLQEKHDKLMANIPSFIKKK